MPVRSLSSSVFAWPNKKEIEGALTDWSRETTWRASALCAVGYFGSYARGDWGVGSDLDLVLVVEQDNRPFERRAAAWDTAAFPVPVDLLVYTIAEIAVMQRRGGRFIETLRRETQWIWRREGWAGPFDLFATDK